MSPVGAKLFHEEIGTDRNDLHLRTRLKMNNNNNNNYYYYYYVYYYVYYYCTL
jgi:hypothetical protein